MQSCGTAGSSSMHSACGVCYPGSRSASLPQQVRGSHSVSSSMATRSACKRYIAIPPCVDTAECAECALTPWLFARSAATVGAANSWQTFGLWRCGCAAARHVHLRALLPGRARQPKVGGWVGSCVWRARARVCTLVHHSVQRPTCSLERCFLGELKSLRWVGAYCMRAGELLACVTGIRTGLLAGGAVVEQLCSVHTKSSKHAVQRCHSWKEASSD